MSAGGVTRWRKKPVEVSMIRWDGTEEAWQLIANHGGLPERLPDGSLNIWVEASQAEMNLDEGAWAIIEPDGSGVYPCRAADHIATYEPVTPAGDRVARWTVTRIALIDALGNLPLGEHLHLEPRGRMADALLAQMPVASEAGFYMEGVKAERERIAQLAEEREAKYDLTEPCGCGRTHPYTGRPCTALIRSGQSFADLIREQP